MMKKDLDLLQISTCWSMIPTNIKKSFRWTIIMSLLRSGKMRRYQP